MIIKSTTKNNVHNNITINIIMIMIIIKIVVIIVIIYVFLCMHKAKATRESSTLGHRWALGSRARQENQVSNAGSV